MKVTKWSIVLFVLLTGAQLSHAQNVPIFTQYYVSPYIYNPAYAGLEGKSSATLTYRKQWYGINDAPVTANFVYHTPLFLGLNMGINATQDNYGIFQSSSALLTLGYTVMLGWNHYLSVGVSGGAGFQNLNYDNINVNDPAYVGVYDKNSYLDGNAGIAYHIANFNLGFALPRIFETNIYPIQNFDTGTLALIKNYIVTADYMIYFGGDNFAFQPYVIYRSYDGFDPQIEGGGIFHIKNLIWVGGAYRQDFGIAGMAGVKLKGLFSFGYSYEIPTTKAEGINKSSHEAQITISLGKKNKRSKKYSTFLSGTRLQNPNKEKKEDINEEEKVKEEPIVEPQPVEEKPVEPEVEEQKEEIQKEEPVIEEKEEQAPIVPPVIEREVTKEPEDQKKPIKQEQAPVVISKAEPEKIQKQVPSNDKTPEVVKHGTHPFELESGHYVVVGVFGKYNNAIYLSDKLKAQGYNTSYGYISSKKLFYVVIHYADDPNITRKKRDELRKKKEFKNAWYLVIE